MTGPTNQPTFAFCRVPQVAVLRPGFTLLELIVALAMASVLAAVLFTDLNVGFKARTICEQSVEPSRSAEDAMNLLRMDLESALPPNANAATTAGIFQGSFEGTANSGGGGEADDLQFFTTAEGPDHANGNGEIKFVELMVEQSGNDQILVRHVTRNLTASVLPDPDEEVICRGVTSFQLEYFDGTQWQTTWDSTVQTTSSSTSSSSTGTSSSSSSASSTGTATSGPLPAAVRVTLVLQRTQDDGQVKTYRFQRVFQLSCSTTIPGATSSSSGT